MVNKKIRYFISVSMIVGLITGVFAVPIFDDDHSVYAVRKKNRNSKNVYVTYKANSGNFTEKKRAKRKSYTVRKIKDKKHGKLPKIKREGYKLKGWYTKKTGGGKVTAETKIKKRTILHARWEKVE